ncbi:spermatogenesis-associated protein 20 [Fennellomyces sp. T-0311]|nr:spermatogenesis-associated protein 20 [Fennellomyces sp. T-0311]
MRSIASRLRSLSLVQARTVSSTPARALLRPTPCGITRSLATQSHPSSAFAKSLKVRACALHTSRVVQAEIPKYTNRLVNEKSPYLLQHAHNPVDWYPWGKEAFDKAINENKPIFLSIGYSTCHWCHVMEHESFENEETAKFMNEHFVNIKVDREENPAVDKLYMTYIQLISGRGGWPMSVFLTPELSPFFGGTYFPPGDQFGTPGFRPLLERVSEIWSAASDKVREDAEATINQLRSVVDSKPMGTEDAASQLHPERLVYSAFKYFESTFDAENGGFTPAPKFPTPVQLQFLFEYFAYFRKDEHAKENAKEALDMALYTLKKIAMGGIHDHIGSGFHRYSTDKSWHVPHFEKMLYDQAQLLSVYTSAYQITRDQGYANVAKDIIQYISRDLQHPAGGFYSAEDADSYPTSKSSKKLEGAFYVWEDSQLEDILGPKAAKVFNRYYGVNKGGNVNPDLDPHNELANQNVLAEQASVDDIAKELSMTPEQVGSILSDAKEKLWKYRENHRPKPHCDDKILTSWNGLMISGLAQAANAFQNKEILKLATDAAEFIHQELYVTKTGTLLRSYRSGASDINGFLDDYSFMIQGLLDLYEATFDEKWVSWAYDLQQKQNELFYDTSKGGYFNVAESDKSILVRLKDEQDGAEPSANAVSLRNLVRLGTILEQEDYVVKARNTVGSFSTSLTEFSFAMPTLLGSFLLMANGVKQIVLTGQDESQLKPFEQVISQVFVPNKVAVRAKKGGFIEKKNPIVAQLANETKAAAYVCENFTCGLPVEDIKTFKAKIEL